MPKRRLIGTERGRANENYSSTPYPRIKIKIDGRGSLGQIYTHQLIWEALVFLAERCGGCFGNCIFDKRAECRWLGSEMGYAGIDQATAED